MTDLTYTKEGDTHHFEFQNINVRLEQVDGKEIGSEGGLKFSMFYRKETEQGAMESSLVDTFVVYPDIIDWEGTGDIKPEYKDKIKSLTEAQQQEAQFAPPPEEKPSEEKEEPTTEEEPNEEISAENE